MKKEEFGSGYMRGSSKKPCNVTGRGKKKTTLVKNHRNI